jgi:uncharacterized protein (TIGR03086 family)
MMGAVSEIGDRYRKVAGDFTVRARAVPEDGWERPAPCEGWVARDVVRHLVEWVPAFFDGVLVVPPGPSVDDDPVSAWLALDGALQQVLDDPEAAGQEYSHPRAGTHRMEDAIATFVLGDVLIHTWDLARATGLDETLDPDEVHRMVDEMEAMSDVLEQSGQYGPRVDVPPAADEQTRLLAASGRMS